MEIILLLIRIVLFAIFALAGIGKLLDLKGSEKAVRAFGTPEELAKFFAVALPFAEIIFAVCLLFVETSWLGAVGAMILLLTFIGGMIWQLAQGNAPDCHCFGAIHSEPVSKKILIRNIVFAVLAFVLILSGKNNQGANIFEAAANSEGNFMSLITGLATVGLLAVVVFYLKKISEQQTQIMRRIEILEVTALDGGREVLREDVKPPTNGLPIGAPAPDFALPDINGKQISFENLLMQTKPMLFLFVSPTCKPCAALLPEIETWQAELKGKLNFIFVSSGDVKDNLEKFAGKTLKQVLLQNDREVALQFGAEWTPTAVLVNNDGTIASRAAVGDKAIRELVGAIKVRIEGAEILLIGDKNDEFFENDINENLVASQDLRGKKTLIAFWSLTCGYCQQMLKDLQDWEQTKGAEEPNLLLLSEGKPEPHHELNLRSPIILDNEREISAELGMSGTPSAVLINEHGKIVSETAVGAEKIWTLLGKRK
jgi:thiol-disulfide isomerase/thioredoxin/uncharacterized membrane protein YphA (DoxX/SURF4 family)